MADSAWYQPEWALPKGVKALQTLRTGGTSLPPYASNNLGLHVGDSPGRVAQNRNQLSMRLPGEPVWLEQVHGISVAELSSASALNITADAAYTRERGVVCAVMTADCLPVLLCSEDGGEIAAVHAGWRGLAAGVIGAAVKGFQAAPKKITAYLCPAISGKHFDVGGDVLLSFQQAEGTRPYAHPVVDAFKASGRKGKYKADLYQLARSELLGLGVSEVFGGDRCTYEEQQYFFSYRRDGVTGRMASLIWREG
ncbi:conserved hypothetical protein [Alteromonadaceae bacterium Bs31]|nr:conserved hypothetical protein [Alteromonadaceae bacterium Bs31]